MPGLPASDPVKGGLELFSVEEAASLVDDQFAPLIISLRQVPRIVEEAADTQTEVGASKVPSR